MVLMTMVLGFYMLLDFNKMEAFCLDLVPTPYREDFRDLLRRTGRVWQAFLRGQAILGLVIGVIVAGVLSIIGLRFALGLGLIAGLFEFVPIFGPFIAGMIAALVAVFQGSNWLAMTPLGYATLVVVIFVVVQQIENNILVPRIIGHSLNLNPFIVLLAIVGGGILAGVLGVLLAAPVVASLRIWLGYVYRKSVGLETLPTPVVEPLLPSEKPGRVVRLKRWWQNSVARTFERSSRNKNE
jgi:predicted PurR-regulated permease PerM